MRSLAPLLALGVIGACADAPSRLDGGALGPDAGLRDSEAPDAAVGAGDAGLEDAGGGGAGEWLSLAPLARGPRQETAVVALDGEIYVLGGFDSARSIVATVEAYDPARDRWRDIAPLPLPLHHAQAAAVDGSIIVAGYLVAGFAEEGRTFRYEPASSQWSERAPMPVGRERGGGAAVSHGGRLLIIGGLRGLISVPDADAYDPQLDRWSPLPPIARTVDHLTAGVLGDRVYAAGGRSNGVGRHVADLDIYDVAGGAWSAGAPMPTSRGGVAGATLGERLFIFGGEGNARAASGVFAETEMFSASSGTWRTLAPMRTPRHGTGAASVGDRVYVPGGADVEGFGAVATLEVFVPPP